VQSRTTSSGTTGAGIRSQVVLGDESPGHRRPIMMRHAGGSRNSARRWPPGRLTEVIVEEPGAGADRQHILQFMTTEHFTLQTARAVANAEITSRLQLYLGTLSSSIVALALTAQLSGLGLAFRGFALVLLRSCSSWGW
jgi:hypothetical protein